MPEMSTGLMKIVEMPDVAEPALATLLSVAGFQNPGEVIEQYKQAGHVLTTLTPRAILESYGFKIELEEKLQSIEKSLLSAIVKAELLEEQESVDAIKVFCHQFFGTTFDSMPDVEANDGNRNMPLENYFNGLL